ncbi:sulfite exporter TauE/SafE family protein [Halostella salina]|uniref:sulfite exporter TauE/SafE family protein n=1 Tax=Halostella salina TaxID=1547897 RepID=UPI000EF8378C|nr:sulfite exporter TauE/SafE family protein [Halostella salina]
MVGLAGGVAAVVFAAVVGGGVVAGITGFGFALVGTAVLATTLPPRDAVVVMIVPIVAANASLASELDRDSLRSCVRRFWPYATAALVGTAVGMALLRRIPAAPMTLSLGLLTLGYVATKQQRLGVPGSETLKRRCFTAHPAAKVGLGFVSGFVFGATNVGVQVVAYLDRLDLERGVFVGVLASVLLGVGLVRIGMAGALGLYADTALLVVSLAAALPGLAGVAAGKRVRSRIPEQYRTAAVYLLLLVVGVRLTWTGMAGL